MLPFYMLAALPILPSFGLDPMVPLFPSLFSVPSATSALKSPRDPIAEFHPAAQQLNHFPLFPHLVNIAHAETPANPSPSIVYITTSVYAGGGGSAHPRTPFSLHATSHACSHPARNPFKRNAYKKTGSPLARLAPSLLTTNYSLLTTHYSLSRPIRYTIPSRHT